MTLFLENFRGALGTTQTEQLIRALNKKKNTGEIRTVKEFSQQLESLIRELTETGMKPMLTLHEGIADKVTHSSQYNDMIEKTENDLSAGFIEANQIDEVQQAHRAIVRDVLLKNLKDAVSELEDRITSYEILKNSRHGFTTLISSTFREVAETRLNRAAIVDLSLSDPRDTQSVSIRDAIVDLIGERLELGYQGYYYLPVRDIHQVFDEEATYTEISVEPYGSSITNVIDGRKNTFFILDQLFTAPRDHVLNKLELDLGGTKAFNFIEIEPVLKRAIHLYKIEYLDLHQRWVEIPIASTLIEGQISVPIAQTIASKVRLTFENTQYIPIAFRYNPETRTVFQHYLEDNRTPVDMQMIAEELDALIPSMQVKELIGLSQNESQEFYGYEYLFGMDNIRVGYALFNSTSIYVSKAMELPTSGTLGLSVVENRPYEQDGITQYTNTTYNLDAATDPHGTLMFDEPDTVKLLGSLEYWIIKQDVKDGRVLKTSKFPILPLGVDHIYHERLVLSKKSNDALSYYDQGYLMFYARPDLENNEAEFKLYRNGTEIVTGPVTFAEVVASPGSGRPMSVLIQVPEPQPGDIFTVSYKPMRSTTYNLPKVNLTEDVDDLDGLKVIDLTGDLTARLAPDSLLVLENGLLAKTDHAGSRIYLMVILRRNTHDATLSPSLEEYTLMSGYLNSNKWKGFE